MGTSRRWSWVVVLLVGVALFEAVRRALVATENPNLLPSLILLGAAVVPATFLAFIAGRRLAVDVSGGVLAVVALVGGVVGVVAAGVLEFDALRRLGPFAVLGVGVIEEAAKLIAPAAVLLLGRRRWRLPADGLLLGVASGAGFAALETMGYAFVTLITSRGDLAAVDGVLLLRGLFSPAAHMAWTGLTATALWAAADRRWSGRAVLGAVAVFVVAVLLHAAWDGFAEPVAYAVLALVSLALLVRATHRLAVAGRAGRGARGGPGGRPQAAAA